jgi:hypothetical protein
MGKSAYICDSCKKIMGDTANEHSIDKSNHKETSTEIQCTAACIGDKDSFSVQLEMVRANGIYHGDSTVFSHDGVQA